MFVRIGLIVLLLSGCQSPSSSYFHTQIDRAGARERARNVNNVLRNTIPIVSYDSGTQVLNIVLIRPNSSSERELREIFSLSLTNGLRQNSSYLDNYINCRLSDTCQAERVTVCVLEQRVSRMAMRNHFDRFSELVIQSGFPVLGVLYREETDDNIVISIPFYDQCMGDLAEISEIWRQETRSADGQFVRAR